MLRHGRSLRLFLRLLTFLQGQVIRPGDLAHRGRWQVDMGPGRDELADDDVLFQPQQVVHLAGDSGLREHSRGLLEGGGRQEATGAEGGLGHSQEDRHRRRGLAALRQHSRVLVLVLVPVDQLARQHLGVARHVDLHLVQHLPDDGLDVLVVDDHPLRVVDPLHLFYQVELYRLRTHDAQDVLRVKLSFGELLAGPHLVAVLHPDSGGGRHRILPLLCLFVHDGDAGGLALPVLEDHPSADPGRDLLGRYHRRLFLILILTLTLLLLVVCLRLPRPLGGGQLLPSQYCSLLHLLVVFHQDLDALGGFVGVAVELGAADR